MYRRRMLSRPPHRVVTTGRSTESASAAAISNVSCRLEQMYACESATIDAVSDRERAPSKVVTESRLNSERRAESVSCKEPVPTMRRCTRRPDRWRTANASSKLSNPLISSNEPTLSNFTPFRSSGMAIGANSPVRIRFGIMRTSRAACCASIRCASAPPTADTMAAARNVLFTAVRLGPVSRCIENGPLCSCTMSGTRRVFATAVPNNPAGRHVRVYQVDVAERVTRAATMAPGFHTSSRRSRFVRRGQA